MSHISSYASSRSTALDSSEHLIYGGKFTVYTMQNCVERRSEKKLTIMIASFQQMGQANFTDLETRTEFLDVFFALYLVIYLIEVNMWSQ